MNQKKNEFYKMWVVPIVIGILLIVIFKPMVKFFPPWFVDTYNDNFNIEKTNKIDTSLLSITSTNNQNITGPIGDTFGGTLGPMIALLAAFLTFLAFWIQYQANRQQENYIKQQRFEDTFFRLLDHYKKIVDSMDIRDGKDVTLIKATGCESFKCMYDFMEKVEDKSIWNINERYNILQNHFKHDLHHYFRFLYHILKFIKKSEISEIEKMKYSSILRASLSSYELLLVFYNCIHINGRINFKPLVEEFSFLKNMDDSLLINKKQKNEYHKIAFASSSIRQELLKDWTNVQMNR